MKELKSYRELKRLPSKGVQLELDQETKNEIIKICDNSKLFQRHGIIFIGGLLKETSLFQDEIPACKDFIQKHYKSKFDDVEFIDIKYLE